MASLLLSLLRRAARSLVEPPRAFRTEGYRIVPRTTVLEEERLDGFWKGKYCPVNIGDIYRAQYQVVGKLGYGVASTVWLARDLKGHSYVTLKVYTTDHGDEEFSMHERLRLGNREHPGYKHVRNAFDSFDISFDGGSRKHHCLVLRPLLESLKQQLLRNPPHRLSGNELRTALRQLFLALDYMHSECQVVHTDIKSDNLFQSVEDPSILRQLVKKEQTHPSPRKFIGGHPIYASRQFGKPDTPGITILGDLGSAVYATEPQTHLAQPPVYRAPEVILRIPWSFPADIWNAGVMIWDVFEGIRLFPARGPNGSLYMTSAHLAQVIGLLGLPPMDLLQRSPKSSDFFLDNGQWRNMVPVCHRSFEEMEQVLGGKNKEMFLSFMRGMLCWRPEDRKTAKELLDDPWLNKTFEN